MDKALRERFEALPAIVEREMDSLQFSVALAEIWKLIGDCNRYIDLTQPWVLGRSEEGKPRLKTVLYYLAECCRAVAVYVGPTMPSTPARMFAQLGVEDENLQTWESVQAFGQLKPGTRVHKGEALFPRIDIRKELEELARAEPAAPPRPRRRRTSRRRRKGFGTIAIDDFAKCSSSPPK